MGRDTSNAAMSNSNTAQGMSSTYGGRATSAYNVLTPTLNRMATNPQGFSQGTMNNMNTAAMQTAGGGNGATVGGAMQTAARTNNAGAYDPAIAQAGHDASTNLSDAALGVQNRNAMLQEQQRQQGISGLQDQYGENTGASQNALGLSTGALGAKNAADTATFNQWFKPFQAIAGGASQAGAASMGCWIAAELFGGWEDPRTMLIRKWLHTDFSRHAFGRAMVKLYLRFGERTAEAMRTFGPLRWMFRPIFEIALSRARKAAQ